MNKTYKNNIAEKERLEYFLRTMPISYYIGIESLILILDINPEGKQLESISKSVVRKLKKDGLNFTMHNNGITRIK